MTPTSTKWKTIKIVFGINFLGILFLGLTFLADLYRVDLPGFRFENFNVQGPLTNYMHGYELLPNVTIRNATYYQSGDYRNQTQNSVTNIAFLKVHKAGSTTMQNLLFRFGLRHNLSIALPRHGNYVYSKNVLVGLKPPKTYNIFACHTIYSKTLFDQLIPTGSVKIGIVREPVDRMVSAAYYYRDVWHVPHLKKIPRANFIHNLINYPEKYDTSFYSRTHNAMGLDFGFKKSIKYTDTGKINAYLDQINSEFVLVMLVEKFEESLIMMKRYLNWSFLDIIYLKTNSHKHNPFVLNKTEQAKIRQTNFLDFAIYEYFAKEFEEKLKSMEADFSSEVKYFIEILSKVSSFCSQKNIQNDSKLLIDKSPWDGEFVVLGKECLLMKTNEIHFIKSIREKQLKQL